MYKDPKETEYIAESTQIDPHRIQDEFVRVSADLSYFSDRFTEASEVYINTKSELKAVGEKLRLDYRNASETKVTEAYLESCVVTDKAHIELTKIMNAAEVKKIHYKGIIDSILTKRDCLISLGSHIRHEMSMSGGVTVGTEKKRK